MSYWQENYDAQAKKNAGRLRYPGGKEMLYMLICLALAYTYMGLMVKSTLYAYNGKKSLMKKEAKKVFAMMPLIVIIFAPFGLSLVFADSAESITTMQKISLYVQWAGVAAALLLAIIFGALSEKGKRFWYTGCSVLSVILSFIFYDSAMFNSGETGQAAGFFIQSIAKDVDCKRGVIVFKYNKEGETEWRCASGIAMMQESDKLFIPWPDYKSGHSSQLTQRINELQDQFKKNSRG
ncbi:hypothetical protein [Cronobacter muytjensii]|uniref:hypothetical protein n=1 Tax=Cronobacter muytjensii TaxID=413501 RepID=UPI0020CA27AB|nr:hypothetical protein [Cronobacter muytjensii]